ncbi:hypothetical protein LCGC14_2936040 [marine sediment metagenome]|uniref:Uncharacterized protein n=1 Tax=marine sediment metagenome TaxID=412755 RepID=A0A0F8ZS31_9ZZZZ
MRVNTILIDHDSGERTPMIMTFRDNSPLPYIIGRHGKSYQLDETEEDENGRWAYYVTGAGTSREPYDDRGDEPPGVGVPVRMTVAEAIVYHDNCPRCGAVLCDSEEEPINLGEHRQATGCLG